MKKFKFPGAKRVRGYTLFIVSLLVLILSLAINSQISYNQVLQASNQDQVTRDSMDVIEKAISTFYKENGYIPCPAQTSLGIYNASFGVSNNCAAAAVGTVDVAVGADVVRVGVVPTRTLNLSDKYMFDGWNNRIRYAVIKGLATSSALFNSYTTLNSRVIKVVDSTSTNINPVSPNVTAYILISHGKDGSGATNFAGTAVPQACLSIINNDTVNCNNVDTFRDQVPNNTVGAATYYDDIVRWRTITNVKKTQVTTTGPTTPVGISALKVATYNTGFQSGNVLVAGCGAANCGAQGTWAPVLATSTAYSPSITTNPTHFLASAGRYYFRMSTPYCGTNRSAGLIMYPVAVPIPTNPRTQQGRYTTAHSSPIAGGTSSCSRSTVIGYFNHDGTSQIQFGRYMENSSNNVAAFGTSYTFAPAVVNNASVYPFEFVQLELWYLD